MAGWFKIQRDIEEHWIWKSNEPFDKRSAWIDLIMLANYKDRRIMDGESVILRKRGDVNYSMLFLAKRWKWDRRKVKRFLMALEMEGMVSLHGASNGTTNGTTITIENYAKHQDAGTTDGTYDGTADVQPMVQQDVHGMYTEEESIRNIRNKESLSYADSDSEKNGWEGQWTYADPVTGRIRFDIDKARKDREL